MNRRDATRALALAPLAFGLRPAASIAQAPGRVYRIGYLSQPSQASVQQALDAFLKALREMGWVEGRNLQIEYRWADGDASLLPAQAAELVARKVDLIVAPAGTAALAAKGATSTIPIVMIFPVDPVRLGLVASLPRPGGNVTGTTLAPGAEIFGRQLQLLKEAVPTATRIAILRNPTEPGTSSQIAAVESAAKAMGVRMVQAMARGPEDFDAAFATMARERAEAMLGSSSSTWIVHRARLAELAIKYRLPTMFNYREMVEAGGLMSYSVNMADFIGRAASYVDRILRGAKPADLPVELPTEFELVVNAKTAKALRLTLPPAFLLRADEVIG